MKKKIALLCLCIFLAGCEKSPENAEKDGPVVFCDDQSITLRAPKGIEQFSNWSGTWKSEEEGGMVGC
jgi:hypothetical protein